MTAATTNSLARAVAVLEERMERKQAEYKTDIEMLARKMAERDARLLVMVAGLIVAGVAVLGFLIRL